MNCRLHVKTIVFRICWVKRNKLRFVSSICFYSLKWLLEKLKSLRGSGYISFRQCWSRPCRVVTGDMETGQRQEIRGQEMRKERTWRERCPAGQSLCVCVSEIPSQGATESLHWLIFESSAETQPPAPQSLCGGWSCQFTREQLAGRRPEIFILIFSSFCLTVQINYL